MYNSKHLRISRRSLISYIILIIIKRLTFTMVGCRIWVNIWILARLDNCSSCYGAECLFTSPHFDVSSTLGVRPNNHSELTFELVLDLFISSCPLMMGFLTIRLQLLTIYKNGHLIRTD